MAYPPGKRPSCKQRGIKFVALQGSGGFELRSASVCAKRVSQALGTPRGSRRISMQAWLLGSLPAGINSYKNVFTNASIYYTVYMNLLGSEQLQIVKNMRKYIGFCAGKPEKLFAAAQ